LAMTAGGRGPAGGTPGTNLRAPIADSTRATVFVLGTDHLSVLPADFPRTALESLLESLRAYEPDVIGVENLPPAEVHRLVVDASEPGGQAAAEILDAFARDAAYWGKRLQSRVGISWREAGARADSLLSAGNASRLRSDVRRTLVALLIAAYDRPSAVLQ